MARIDELLRSIALALHRAVAAEDPRGAGAPAASRCRAFTSCSPTFASITYGAAGSTRRPHPRTRRRHPPGGRTEPMAHLACFAHRPGELVEILERYARRRRGERARRAGRPPREATGPFPAAISPTRSNLVELVKSVAPFCVAVAAHPEGHPSAPDLATDRRHLAAKLDVADFAITQFFFIDRRLPAARRGPRGPWGSPSRSSPGSCRSRT